VGLDPSAPNGRPAADGSEAAPAAIPKIAEKADDLEAIKQAVDDAAPLSSRRAEHASRVTTKPCARRSLSSLSNRHLPRGEYGLCGIRPWYVG
jgi:hypothetical protein